MNRSKKGKGVKWMIVILMVIIIGQTFRIYSLEQGQRDLDARIEQLQDSVDSNSRRTDFLFKDYQHRQRTF